MMAVSIDAGQQLHPARSRLLFADNAYLSSSRQATYDVHPDGQHFLMIHRGSAQDQVVVMVNWLERKAPR
jgi:hypothetical protein